MKAFVKIMPLIKLKSTLTNLAVVREGQFYKNILELPSEHLPNLRLLRKLKSVRACIEPRSIQNNLAISFCQPTAIVILIKLFAYKMYFKTYFRFEWTRSKGTDVKCANHNARKKKGEKIIGQSHICFWLVEKMARRLHDLSKDADHRKN